MLKMAPHIPKCRLESENAVPHKIEMAAPSRTKNFSIHHFILLLASDGERMGQSLYLINDIKLLGYLCLKLVSGRSQFGLRLVSG